MFSLFEKFPKLKYGFSEKQDGSMHRHLEKENRAAYFRRVGIDPNRVVTADSVHDVKVQKVGDEMAGEMVSNTDGLITNVKNLFLTATGADCFLLYLYDPASEAIGIVHIGWRGALGGIAKNAVEAFASNFGSTPYNLLAGISPGIQKCHFEISSADKVKYEEYPDFMFERDGKVFVDLPGIIKFQLLQSGLSSEHIEDSGVCTYCSEEKYFSYRRDKPKDVQPMVAYIGMKK